MNTKGDQNRSVRNTKKKLRSNLLELLHEKPINAITVRELTERADVNRGTFYFHYSDIYDMLAKLENEFFIRFDEITNALAIIQGDNRVHSYIAEIFSFLLKNADLCEILLGPHGDMDFVNRLKKLVDEKCFSNWQAINPEANIAQFELFNSFIINGFIGLFEKWLSSGHKQKPEEMASFAVTLIKGGMHAILAK